MVTIFGSMASRSTNKFNKIISFLNQKVIDSETSAKEIFDSGEDNLPENIDTFDIAMQRDLGTRSNLKQVGNIYRMVEGADWQNILRLDIKFCNAAGLYDYARKGNKSWVYGLGQIPILMMKKVDDNVLGWEFNSFFNGFDQFAYTEDNPQVQIAPFFADSSLTHISFFDSVTPVSIAKQVTAQTSVMFTKVDDDQLKDGYAATMNDKGDLFFYIRRNFKQYSLFLKGVYYDQLQAEITSGGDFNAANFNESDFNTDKEYTSNLICNTVHPDDHWFVYQKSNNLMKYILNGVSIFDSSQAFSIAPILDVPLQDGAYNTDGTDRTTINDISTNNYNGTLGTVSEGQWQTDNTWLSYGANSTGTANGTEITFPTITALDSATEFTISFVYKPDTTTNTYSYDRILVWKNWGNSSAFILYRPAGTNNLAFIHKNSSGTNTSVTYTDAFTEANKWYSIIVKGKVGQVWELTIDGNAVSGSGSPPTEITTSSTLKLFRATRAARGTICLLRVWITKLGSVDTQRILDEGYHNPTFPKAEKPQPVPDPSPPPVTNPFISFYNLASQSPTIDIANTVWLNSVAGQAAFNEFYNVADGTPNVVPEVQVYSVPVGTSTVSDPYVIQGVGSNPTFTIDSSDNSSGVMDNTNASRFAVKIRDSTVDLGAILNGKVITKATFWLRGANTPVGAVYCRLWDNTGALKCTYAYNGGTLDASALSGTFTAYDFVNNSNTFAMAQGWRIGIEYITSDSNDEVDVQRRSADVYTGTCQDHYDSGGWAEHTGYEIRCTLYTGTGTTGSNSYYQISNASGGQYQVTEYFPTSSAMIGKTLTKLEFRVCRDASATSGTATVRIDHVAADGSFKANLVNVLVSTLPIFPASEPTTFNFTWQDVNYANSILANEAISINTVGLTAGKVLVMSNKGNNTTTDPTKNFDGTVSYLRTRNASAPQAWNSVTSEDVSGNMYTGGNNFTATVAFSSSLTRIYEKAAGISSALNGKKLTKVIARMKRVGAPTGNITCVIRAASGDGVKLTVGSVDVSTISNAGIVDVTFTNVANTTVTIAQNDRVSFEFLGADASNYIEVTVNTDVFETTNTISGTFSSPTYTDNAQQDISAKMYTGGELDTSSRTRVAQKVATNSSIIKGKKLTKIGIWLINPNGALGNIYCQIFRGSDPVNPIVTIGTAVAASSIGTSYQYVEFSNTLNTYVMNLNDTINIVFESGDSSHQIGVHVRENTNYDGANSFVVTYDSVQYYDMVTWDLVATMWYGGDTYQPPANAIPDPTPTNNKDLLYCAGNNLTSGFFRALQREFAIYVEDTTEAEALNRYQNRYSKTSRVPQEVLVAGLYKPF